MHLVRRFAVLSAIFAALLLAAPTAVFAARAYQGQDYAEDHASRTVMWACDREADSIPVKAVLVTTGGSTFEVKDSDGSNGNCASRGSFGTVQKFKACEYRSAWPDDCGNWYSY